MKFSHKKIVPQVIALLVLFLIFGYLAYNAQTNMGNRGMEFGYDFLARESSFDIQFSLIEYSRSSSYARAYLVGLINTLLVAVTGIIFATILGVIIGIARLSNNFLIRNMKFLMLAVLGLNFTIAKDMPIIITISQMSRNGSLQR